MINRQFILVLGYGWSGSSAVVDLLKEYAGNIEADVEFRVIKDPYGITDLYNSLILKGDPLNYDIAIKDFLWFTRKLNTITNKIECGLGYKKFFGDNFLKCTQEYINNITDFEYASAWWMFDFKKSKSKLFIDRLLGKMKFKTDMPKMYFSSITKETFLKQTQKYIENLFEPFFSNGVNNVILDQGISVLGCLEEMNYFENAKVIIVDRDPRDIYTDLCKGNFLIGRELSDKHEPIKYVKWHKTYRRNNNLLRNNKQILMVNFEDIILNYESTLNQIESFLEIDCSNHENKMKYLKPEISVKNIGIWKEYMSEKEVDCFDKELMEYYYQ